MPFARRPAPRRADDRLEVDLDQLVGELLLASGTRAAPDSCRPSSRRSCRRSRSGTRPATARMFSTIRSKVPWPPRSGRIRLWVSRSPSSVIFTPFSPNGSSRSTTSSVSSRPLVMMLMTSSTPRACGRAATAARPGSTSPAGSAAARRRRTSATSFSGRTRSSSRSIQSPTRAAVSSDILSANLL